MSTLGSDTALLTAGPTDRQQFKVPSSIKKKKNKPKPNILVSPERVQNSFFAFHSSSASLGLQETLLNSNE